MLLRSGRQVTIARAKKEITSYQLAKEVGTSQGVIATWEGGRTPGSKIINTISEIILSILDNIDQNQFWQSIHYEKYIYNTAKPTTTQPAKLYTENINAIHYAIYTGLAHHLKTENSDNITINQETPYLLWFLGEYNMYNFLMARKPPQRKVTLNYQKIIELEFNQKVDFIMYLYRHIGFIYDPNPDGKPGMIFTPWGEKNSFLYHLVLPWGKK